MHDLQVQDRIEWLKPEWLCLGCIDYFPDIDPHAIEKYLKLIHQSNVYRPVDVLEALSLLQPLSKTPELFLITIVIESLCGFQATTGITANHLGHRSEAEIFVCRSSRSGEKAR